MLRKILYIQIPCLNEEKTIAQVIKGIPYKELKSLGMKVNILVIDDNSSDRTIRKAKQAGADFVLRNRMSLGLAKSFKEGIDYCLRHKADIIVNIDGDNQYDQNEIPKIIEPIIRNQADMVIGDRQIKNLNFMPINKKIGNQIGSWMMRLLTGLPIRDASSGFRAFNRELVERLSLQSIYTYTHETIIQAANMNAKVIDIPIKFRERVAGDSRLIEGVFDHIKKSSVTIIRAILIYRAFKYLFTLGLLTILLGILGVLRFMYFFVYGDGGGHIQSLIISSVLINLGFVTIVLGIIADLISVNRKILEEIKMEQKYFNDSR